MIWVSLLYFIFIYFCFYSFATFSFVTVHFSLSLHYCETVSLSLFLLKNKWFLTNITNLTKGSNRTSKLKGHREADKRHDSYYSLSLLSIFRGCYSVAFLFLTFCCCCSVTKSCTTLCNPMNCITPGSLSFTVSWSLLRFMSIELMMLSNHLICCYPLLLLPPVFPNIRVFSNEMALHIRWPKYWYLSISPSNEYSGLISFRIDWFDLLIVQGTLKRFESINFLMLNLDCPTLTPVQDIF